MMAGKRIFFFNRFFWPDQSATAQILTDLCRDLDARGYRITVVSSRLDYSNKTIQYRHRESLGGVKVVRLWSTRFGRGTLAGRLLDYLTIYYSFFAYILRNLGPDDIVVLKTDPPLLSILGALGRMVKQFRLVSWCQDVFPEVAMVGMQESILTDLIFQPLKLIRDWSLAASDRVVVLGHDMWAYLAGRRLDPRRMACISNWSVQSDEPHTREADLRRQWGIREDAFVVGYSGNLGRAHDWRTLLAVARRFRGDENVVFLFCGGGHGYDHLREAVGDESLSSQFVFLPYQPLEDLASSLRVPDVHWFTLKEAMTPFIYPSKFFGILQAGRAVVFVGDPESEIASIIRESALGTTVREGDTNGFTECLGKFRSDRILAEGAGRAARDLWEQRFRKTLEVDKWDRMLKQLREQID
jgi:colanic acid biosynthesis glycosyl transferase WcaI